MSARLLRGLSGSAGAAVGRAYVLRDVAIGDGGKADAGGPGEVERALGALAAVSEELKRAAERLQAAGLSHEAEIVETSALIAGDPALAENVGARAATLPAAQAVGEAVEEHARALAALPDPMLAARAADVRELGRRAARILAGAARKPLPTGVSVLVARDLGPGEVAELELGDERIAGIALAEGAATSHAAIMARSLGVPMVVALGATALEIEDGEVVVVDGDEGTVCASPGAATLAAARATVRRNALASQALARSRSLPVETRDGHRVTLLCNASTAAEVAAGLAAGSDGVGLLRTELAFLDALGWPTEAEHRAALGPPLALLAGRTATVRTLDFGADKTPPFLEGVVTRGLALTLERPDALAAQLRAIATAGAGTRLRVLLPLVESAADVKAVRTLLDECLAEGEPTPALGAMIETPGAARNAAEIAIEADFVSIGTNDLVATTLGLDREAPLASAQSAAEPEVLRLVAATVAAAHAAGRTVEVCGEAASELTVAALLVGIGVDELSVAPARIDAVRVAVRSLDFGEARAAADAALEANRYETVVAIAGELLLSGELDDEGRETLDARGGVIA